MATARNLSPNNLLIVCQLPSHLVAMAATHVPLANQIAVVDSSHAPVPRSPCEYQPVIFPLRFPTAALVNPILDTGLPGDCA